MKASDFLGETIIEQQQVSKYGRLTRRWVSRYGRLNHRWHPAKIS